MILHVSFLNHSLEIFYAYQHNQILCSCCNLNYGIMGENSKNCNIHFVTNTHELYSKSLILNY